MEGYFDATGVGDIVAKLRAISVFCNGVAMLWWRKRKIDAKVRMRRLEHKTSLLDYVKEYYKLLLELPSDMEDKKEMKLEALKLLKAIQGKATYESKGLMFVEVWATSKKLNALVDTGASNLFILKEAVEKMGLRIEKGRGRIMIVNSVEVPAIGIAREVYSKLDNGATRKH
ncbi:hypothetical protein MLD38_006324 [Melastoma candidum]|uniref:Uncharacterized protein n=1 Tax=Melastoma candidum TaxID=119954 RepID=A0ACB9RMK2_9MYRT|nr:hypothetical protein MLD38_006324 [Melastoma candidum]